MAKMPGLVILEMSPMNHTEPIENISKVVQCTKDSKEGDYVERKEVREMNNQPQLIAQLIDDKLSGASTEKKGYERPTLKKLGNVKEVTEGVHLIPVPDVGGMSL